MTDEKFIFCQPPKIEENGLSFFSGVGIDQAQI
jgi:hypothetical protein